MTKPNMTPVRVTLIYDTGYTRFICAEWYANTLITEICDKNGQYGKHTINRIIMRSNNE